MAELENMIESLMSSPESLGKIMDVVKMFGVGEAMAESPAAAEPQREPAIALPGFGAAPMPDADTISKVMELLRDYNADNDRRIKLLLAIRPFLKDEDSVHIDRAIQIVKLSHVAKSIFKNFLK